MKLKKLLRILDLEIVVRLFDDYKLDLVVKVKDIPKELKERSVNRLYRPYFDIKYDLSIFLKV